jgi:phosphoribosylformimino-5-aminoimidazole carboxamide ribotide isomerase
MQPGEAMRVSDFRVIPVLDVKHGRAVHAIGGDRSHYQPVRSRLHPSADPEQIARAYRDVLGLREVYLADLDAILGKPPGRVLYQTLAKLDLHLWIDAGIRIVDDLVPLLELERSTIVVGLETVDGPVALRKILDQAGAGRIVLSLDLFNGVPRFSSGSGWSSADPALLARQILELGARRLLLLDLARVGTGRGTGTSDLLVFLHRIDAGVEISVGGGIGGVDEVVALRDQGATAVLIGSALHDGRLGQQQLSSLGG